MSREEERDPPPDDHEHGASSEPRDAAFNADAMRAETGLPPAEFHVSGNEEPRVTGTIEASLPRFGTASIRRSEHDDVPSSASVELPSPGAQPANVVIAPEPAKLTLEMGTPEVIITANDTLRIVPTGLPSGEDGVVVIGEIRPTDLPDDTPRFAKSPPRRDEFVRQLRRIYDELASADASPIQREMITTFVLPAIVLIIDVLNNESYLLERWAEARLELAHGADSVAKTNGLLHKLEIGAPYANLLATFVQLFMSFLS